MAPPALKLPTSNHVPIGTASCESCHAASNFTTFLIADKSPPMDHAAVTALSCASCHGPGLTFVGTPPVVTLPATHVPVSAANCALCHGSSSFQFLHVRERQQHGASGDGTQRRQFGSVFELS